MEEAHKDTTTGDRISSMDIDNSGQLHTMDHLTTGEANNNTQDVTATYGNSYLQAQTDQEYQAAESQEAWQSQTFQIYECSFDTRSSFNGSTTNNIVKTFTTGELFNTTVGESRVTMGIQGDDLKMTNGRENNFFKALKWSPDGSCLLSSSNDNCMRIFALPDSTVEYKVNIAPNALCFNLDGSKIYCGSNNMIQIFDTTRPGKDCQKKPTVPTRKSKKGQKGVISCLAFNPDHSDLYAAGSFLKTIGLYDSRAEELMLLLRDKDRRTNRRRGKSVTPVAASTNGNEATTSSTITAPLPQVPMGGLTQVQFSPDGVYLYSASRQDPFIRCWDIRNTASVLFRLERPGDLTNQRLGFDISSDGRWLSTGDMNGDVSIFNLSNPTDPASERLATRIYGHDDVISTAAFHPTGSMLATSSGQRKYELFDSDDSDSDSEEDSEEESQQTPESTLDKDFEPPVIDNSISLWSLPGEYVWYVNGQRWAAADQSTKQQQEGEDVNAVANAADSTMALDERINSSTPAPTVSGDVVMENAAITITDTKS
ncbi:Telomerase Cajal body protein 1 [Linnemannia zychae]|nr:Telomerase Cajal body protein 1 [Linnemannia zychae]